MAEKMIVSFKKGWSGLYSTLSFRIFLVLVALEVTYSAAEDFMFGFGRGICSVVGG